MFVTHSVLNSSLKLKKPNYKFHDPSACFCWFYESLISYKNKFKYNPHQHPKNIPHISFFSQKKCLFTHHINKYLTNLYFCCITKINEFLIIFLQIFSLIGNAFISLQSGVIGLFFGVGGEGGCWGVFFFRGGLGYMTFSDTEFKYYTISVSHLGHGHLSHKEIFHGL